MSKVSSPYYPMAGNLPLSLPRHLLPCRPEISMWHPYRRLMPGRPDTHTHGTLLPSRQVRRLIRSRWISISKVYLKNGLS